MLCLHHGLSGLATLVDFHDNGGFEIEYTFNSLSATWALEYKQDQPTWIIEKSYWRLLTIERKQKQKHKNFIGQSCLHSSAHVAECELKVYSISKLPLGEELQDLKDRGLT